MLERDRGARRAGEQILKHRQLHRVRGWIVVTLAAEGSVAPADAAAAPAPAPAPAAPKATPAQQALLTDLHWLVHQGHVIEFANGLLETAKKPAPRPTPTPKAPKKSDKPAAAPEAATAEATSASATETEAIDDVAASLAQEAPAAEVEAEHPADSGETTPENPPQAV